MQLLLGLQDVFKSYIANIMNMHIAMVSNNLMTVILLILKVDADKRHAKLSQTLYNFQFVNVF